MPFYSIICGMHWMAQSFFAIEAAFFSWYSKIKATRDASLISLRKPAYYIGSLRKYPIWNL